jgi:hypothetical protein
VVKKDNLENTLTSSFLSLLQLVFSIQFHYPPKQFLMQKIHRDKRKYENRIERVKNGFTIFPFSLARSLSHSLSSFYFLQRVKLLLVSLPRLLLLLTFLFIIIISRKEK